MYLLARRSDLLDGRAGAGALLGGSLDGRSEALTGLCVAFLGGDGESCHGDQLGQRLPVAFAVGGLPEQSREGHGSAAPPL